jgi:DNA-directed RNA polymerase specialized sigma subunit
MREVPMFDEIDRMMNHVLRKAHVHRKETVAHTKTGRVVTRRATDYEDGRTRRAQPAKALPKITDLTLARHLKELKAAEARLNVTKGPARKVLEGRIAQMRNVIERLTPRKPSLKAPAKKPVKTADKTARKQLKHSEPTRMPTKAPASGMKVPASKAPKTTAATTTKRTVKTADKTATRPLRHKEPAKIQSKAPAKVAKRITPKEVRSRLEAVVTPAKRSAKATDGVHGLKPGQAKAIGTTGKALPADKNTKGASGKGRSAVKPEVHGKLGKAEHAAVRHPAKGKAPVEVKDAAKGAGKLNLGKRAKERDQEIREAHPTFFMDRKKGDKWVERKAPKGKDVRIEIPGESEGHHRNWFPDSEAHLAAKEPQRAALVRTGEPINRKQAEEFKTARKGLETEYLKTWTPMLKALAKRSLHAIGIEPRISEDGHPEGMYADFIQEAFVVALRALRSHDPKTHKTGLRDLVVGNVQRHLFEKWRSIIGAGMGSVRANAGLTKLSKVTEALSQKLGRAPTEDELAEGMERTVEEVRKLRQTAMTLATEYLDKKVGGEDGDDGIAFGNLLGAERPGPDSLLEEMDMHSRLSNHLREAMEEHVKDPRAKLALAHELGYHDHIDRYAGQVIREHHLGDLADEVMRQEGNHAKLVRPLKGVKPTLEPEQIVKAIGHHPAFAGRSMDARTQLVSSIREHGYDPHRMLTTGFEDDEREEGARIAKEGAIRNKLAQRLGYSRSLGGKWVKDAMDEMRRHEGLAKFASEDLSKSWSHECDIDPRIQFYREMFGKPFGTAPLLLERVTMFQGPASFSKALEGYENVWTVTMEDGSSYQMVVETLDELDLAKSWGTDLAKQHPGGRWVTVHGIHVFIDKGGQIIAGPAKFRGKHIDEMKGHLESEHGAADKKGKVSVPSHVSEAMNAEHSDTEGLHGHLTQEHTLSANGKTIKVKTTGEYTGMKGKEAKSSTKMLEAYNPETGEKFKDARSALRHLGIETRHDEARVNESAGVYMERLLDPHSRDHGKAQDMADAMQRRIRAALDAGGVGQKGKYTSKSTKEEIKQVETTKAAAQYAHNPEASTGEHQVYTATASGGAVHHIKVARDSGKIVDSPMLEQVIGHREIRSEDDLRQALKDVAGQEQTVSLSNGRSHYLLRVQHDGSGSPVVTNGRLKGKHLHEIIGKNGGLQHYADPVEHNGKRLYAGWDAKQNRMTALGNWSEERAFEHFGAESDDEKQAVRDKIAAADAASLPPVAHAKMDANGHIQVALPYARHEIEAAREINHLGFTNKALTPEDLDTLAAKLAHDVTGKHLRRQFADQARSELGPDASKEQLEAKVKELVKQHYDFDNIHKIKAAAEILANIKNDGMGGAKEIGPDRDKHGFTIGIGQLERMAGHLGAVRMDTAVRSALDEHRQRLQDEASRARAIAEEQGLKYLPHLRSDDPTDGHLPTTIRQNLRNPNSGKDMGPLYFTRPQEQFIQRFAEGHGRLINALGVGNGKTMSSLAAMESHKKLKGEDGPKKTLVIVPGNDQAESWKQDFAKMMQPGKGGQRPILSIGKKPHKDATYHVVTTAMIANPKTTVKTDDGRTISLARHLHEQGFDSAIIDEAHKLNGSTPEKSSQRKAVMAVLHGKEHKELGLEARSPMKAMIAATGTPMQNHPTELHGLVELIHHGQHDLGSRKAFEARFTNRRVKGGQSHLAPGADRELGPLLANYMHRSTPEDLATEQRPPMPQVEQHVIRATHEPVETARGKFSSGVDMLEAHHQDIHSMGADELISGEQDGKRKISKGAFQAIGKAERDLVSLKEAHVENKLREILAQNPHAKIGAFSNSHEGQEMLQRVMGRVMGDHNDQDAAARHAHYQRALDEMESQRDHYTDKHRKLTDTVGKQAERLKAFRDLHKDKLAQNPKAQARFDDLIRNTEIRHTQLQTMGGGDGHYAAALKEAIGATKHAMGSRHGYRFTSITHDADANERQEIQRQIREDGSLKGVVLSTKMAATGINAGHLTHLIDVDGHWNSAELEQMYARHARLTGSVPTSKVIQMQVHAPDGAMTKMKDGREVPLLSLDQRKAMAVQMKTADEQRVTKATRRGPASGAQAVARVKGNEYGHGKLAAPEQRKAKSRATSTEPPPEPAAPDIAHDGSDLGAQHIEAAKAAVAAHKSDVGAKLGRTKERAGKDRLRRQMKAADAVHGQLEAGAMNDHQSWSDLHDILKTHGKAAGPEHQEALAKVREHADTLRDEATFNRAKGALRKAFQLTWVPGGVYIA